MNSHSLSEILNELSKGNNVARYEWGDSMMPLLQSGMTHMVMMISRIQNNPMYLIGSPNYNEITGQFTIYGWTSNVFAKAIGTKIIHSEKEE